ncbi:hypothetical protein M3573_16530 [Bacillus safensis]|uniref:hypothetical protein n=1 Tax=Bacillus safensis TaxID=561879 RepID=UPI00203D7348|nr:hypothetical protein [Bacillus safensis]MCM3139894.1 hypothetical protein [Bacillus safensis]
MTKEEPKLSATEEHFGDEDFIFAQADGHPENIKKFNTRMRRLLKRMDLKKKIT